MQNVIREKLREIEEKENVRIIMAIESGSRAWGFASQDSDYDVRFIYVRRTEDYLKLNEMRDVIEWQLDDVLDINGWDIKKALRLVHKCNPTVFEWCASPIVYKSTDEFKDLRKLLPKYFSVQKGFFHYWHMADSNYRDYLKGDMVWAKKYLYVIRPLLAAKWIKERHSQPPMLFTELVEAVMDKELLPEINNLLELKKVLKEREEVLRIQVLNDYIESNMEQVKKWADEAPETYLGWDELNEFFLKVNNFK
ncbi:MAG: nucleotidyltransferase domain-containing protein [Parabacteroides sp.]|nr:nucleotidyltransferase domain-containing protein [Parabacteroides sp.]MDO4755120.1 nucleotidyltransferase domain-containing protein [Parabacteroides sp.]